MRADMELYLPTSIVEAIILSRLGIPPGCHALDIEAVGLITGQLDRLPSRGEYKKVICCDTCALLPEITTICIKWLNSLYPAPPAALGLFCVVALICWWLGIRYIRRSVPYESRTSRKTIRLLRAKIAGTSQVFGVVKLAPCLGMVELHIWAVSATNGHFGKLPS